MSPINPWERVMGGLEGLFNVVGWLYEKLGWGVLLLWLFLLALLVLTVRTARRAIRGEETRKFDWAFPVHGRWLGYALAAFALIVLVPGVWIPAGALFHCLFTWAAYRVLQPTISTGGEFGMIYIITIPFGALMGLGLGISSALYGLGWKRGAPWTTLLTGIGIIVFAWAAAASMGNDFQEFIVLPGAGSPAGWGIAFILAGVVDLLRQRVSARRAARLGEP